MKVDVLLISYNQETFIAQTIESILAQRVKSDVNISVIIADDCSTDKTLEIIKSYEEISLFPFVYLYNDKNLGITKNYQRAFNACDGDYIAVLEGDDYWSTPNHLENHIRFLSSHHECCMSMNRISYIRPETPQPITFGWNYNEDVHYVDTKSQIKDGNQLGNLSACVFRTSCIKSLESSLYDLYLADWMLGVMLSQKGLIAILKESTSVYRQNPHSKWAALSRNEQISQLINLAESYDKYQNGLYHEEWAYFIKKLKRSKYKSYKKFLPKPFINIIIKMFRKVL